MTLRLQNFTGERMSRCVPPDPPREQSSRKISPLTSTCLQWTYSFRGYVGFADCWSVALPSVIQPFTIGYDDSSHYPFTSVQDVRQILQSRLSCRCEPSFRLCRGLNPYQIQSLGAACDRLLFQCSLCRLRCGRICRDRVSC